MTAKIESRRRIVEAMRHGGYYDNSMARGPELDRVKAYLRMFAGELEPASGHPLQRPQYPCFAGLRHTPFHDRGTCTGASELERAFDTVRDEALGLRGEDCVVYTPPSTTAKWSVYLFYHMGVDVELLASRCPRTFALVKSLPRLCADYPWGDVLFSMHSAKSHLRAHCSVVNLTLRCHVGIIIPPDCEMRVGTETRTWKEGEGLLFEDSFEHEVWNRSDSDRLILIVDFWHPDLTDAEIAALTAGFRKAEGRRIIFPDDDRAGPIPAASRRRDCGAGRRGGDPQLLELTSMRRILLSASAQANGVEAPARQQPSGPGTAAPTRVQLARLADDVLRAIEEVLRRFNPPDGAATAIGRGEIQREATAV